MVGFEERVVVIPVLETRPIGHVSIVSGSFYRRYFNPSGLVMYSYVYILKSLIPTLNRLRMI